MNSVGIYHLGFSNRSTLPPTLLSLPLELRHKIYDDVIFSLALHGAMANPSFFKNVRQWSPVPQRLDAGSLGDIEGLHYEILPSNRSIFAINKQIREESRDYVFSKAFCWAVIKTNIPSYRLKLLKAGFPDCFEEHVKHPLVTVDFRLPDFGSEMTSSFAFPVVFIQALYRAINITKGKPRATLTIELHDPPNLPSDSFQCWMCNLATWNLSVIYGLHKVAIKGRVIKCKTWGEPKFWELRLWEELCRSPANIELLTKTIRLKRATADKSFREGDWEDALRTYLSCLVLIRDLYKEDWTAFRNMTRLRSYKPDFAKELHLMLSNVAFCCLKQNNAVAAIPFSTFVIEGLRGLPQLWSEACYRRGLAYKAVKMYKHAAADFNAALKCRPEDLRIIRELESLRLPLAQLFPVA